MHLKYPLLASLMLLGVWSATTQAGPFAPAAGQPGSEAIAQDSPLFVGWATSVVSIDRGPLNIADPGLGDASFGSPDAALGISEGLASGVVSLGDGGSITLGFDRAIIDGPGFDLAVFENSFADTFLELAFVEVSSNGVDYFRFPSVSLTQTDTQVGGFGSIDPTDIDNLAGKYRGGFGTPFDLAELAGISPLLDVNDVQFVRIVDAIGTIDDDYASRDSLGNPINEPYPTPFASGGFDLDAVGVIHAVPEPTSLMMLALGLVGVRCAGAKRRRAV